MNIHSQRLLRNECVPTRRPCGLAEQTLSILSTSYNVERHVDENVNIILQITACLDGKVWLD